MSGRARITLVTLGGRLSASILNRDQEWDDELVRIDDADAGAGRVVVPGRHDVAAAGGLLSGQDLGGGLARGSGNRIITKVMTCRLQQVALAAIGSTASREQDRLALADRGPGRRLAGGVTVRHWTCPAGGAYGPGTMGCGFVPGGIFALVISSLEVVAHLLSPGDVADERPRASATDMWLGAACQRRAGAGRGLHPAAGSGRAGGARRAAAG